MKYTQLPDSYKYDTLAEAIYSREMEHFHYDLDAVNFARLIETAPNSPYKMELEARLSSTLEQMKKVEDIYSSLQAQITDQEAYAAAVERAVAKRNAPK